MTTDELRAAYPDCQEAIAFVERNCVGCSLFTSAISTGRSPADVLESVRQCCVRHQDDKAAAQTGTASFRRYVAAKLGAY